MAGAAAAIGAIGYVVATRRRLVTLRPLAMTLAVATVAVALGAVRQSAWLASPPASVEALASAWGEADGVTVWGRVAEPPERSWAVRFAVDVDSVGRDGARDAIRGRVQATLRVGDAGAVYPALRTGDRVRLDGRLAPLPRPRNPAAMDYGAYLRRQGVGAVLDVRGETGARFLAPSRRLADRATWAIRSNVRRALAAVVPGAESRALLLALILADRTAIEAGTLEAFRATGLMHLLAVSGLHVGLVGLALYVILKPVLGRFRIRRRRIEVGRAVVTLAVLAMYVAVAGASVSTVRAFVMVALLIVGRTLERPADSLNALGLAAIVLIVHRPAALFDVGFQLSFGAVAALVTLTPLLTATVPERWRHSRAGSFLVGSLATSVAATLGTAPALLAHLGRLPIGGLVLNVPAIPLTAMTLGSGLGAVVLAPVSPLSAALGAFSDAMARALLWVTKTGADTLGWATYAGFLESPSVMLAAVLALVALALWRRPIAHRRVAIAATASLALGLWVGVARGDAAPRLDVLFLDVGQGDATLLATPGGRHVLVDAGLRSMYVDEGARVVVPHLERAGIARLDALVLTHADADHIGGAATVLRSVPVGRLIVNGQPGQTDLWREVLAVADSAGVTVQSVGAGDTLAVDPALRIRVLGPSGPMPSPNDASIVLRVEHGLTRWLLTGDAEAAGEAAVVGRFGDWLAADVVTVGHHGSRTSSSPAMVDAAGRPAFAVVSVARRNRYGLPDEEPLGRWLTTGAEVLQTANEGAVWLRSDGETVERVEWRGK